MSVQTPGINSRTVQDICHASRLAHDVVYNAGSQASWWAADEASGLSMLAGAYHLEVIQGAMLKSRTYRDFAGLAVDAIANCRQATLKDLVSGNNLGIVKKKGTHQENQIRMSAAVRRYYDWLIPQLAIGNGVRIRGR